MQQTMIQSHIPFPHASALFVSLVEFTCGGGLVLGLLTPLCDARRKRIGFADVRDWQQSFTS
jgi:hypothetical protein